MTLKSLLTRPVAVPATGLPATDAPAAGAAAANATGAARAAARPPKISWRHRPALREAVQPTFIASVLLLVAVVTASFAPSLFTPFDPYVTNVVNKFAAPSLEHWWGTDSLGRDQFTRFVFGTANTLVASLIAVLIGFVVSSVLGVLAGYFRGWIDEGVSRFVDVFLAVPSLLVSLLIVTSLGFGTVEIAIAVGVGSIATFTRILRGEVFRVRESDYVTAARVNGLPWYKILTRHVFPHAIGPIIALIPLEFGIAVLLISSLSFLGFGVQPPEPEWGVLVSDGRTYLSTAWWLAIVPGLVIALVVLSANRVSTYVERVIRP